MTKKHAHALGRSSTTVVATWNIGNDVANESSDKNIPDDFWKLRHVTTSLMYHQTIVHLLPTTSM